MDKEINARIRRIATRVGLALIFIATACKGIPYLYEFINVGDTVWVTSPSGATGLDDCHIPQGKYKVEKTHKETNDVYFGGCWIDGDDSEFITHEPKPTATTRATQTWVRAEAPTPRSTFTPQP